MSINGRTEKEPRVSAAMRHAISNLCPAVRIPKLARVKSALAYLATEAQAPSFVEVVFSGWQVARLSMNLKQQLQAYGVDCKGLSVLLSTSARNRSG